MRNIYKYLLAFIFIACSLSSFAQKRWSAELGGFISQNGKRLDGVSVTVMKNGAQSEVVTTVKGKYSVTLEPNNDYLIKFSKEGLVTKSININTRNVPDDAIDVDGFQFHIEGDAEMYESIAGIDFSVLNQPIAKFAYDPETKLLAYDAAYTSSILARVQQLQKEYERKMKEEAARLAAEKALNEKYQAAINKGDAAFNSKSFPAAKAAYTEAAGLKPNEKHPKDRLTEIENILANQGKEKELEEKYKAAIAAADKAFTAKDYTGAKASYSTASGLKPAEGYPRTRIAEIDKILADDASRLAKEKELNEKYTAAIAAGEKAFNGKDFASAKTSFTEASSLKPAEKYPKDKLLEIEKALAQALKDKEIEEKYKAAVAAADQAFSAKDFSSAKTRYTEALGLKPSEQHPKTRLSEIEALLAESAKEKEAEAKYQAAVVRADKAFGSKDYATAKTAYAEASAIKPSEKYPKEKLAEIEKILADAAAKDAAEKERLAKEKELEEKYKAAVASGDKALLAKDYSAAKSSFTEASGLKPAEQYPKTKLSEIERLLADLAAKDAAEKEKQAKEKELTEKYNAAIAAGDKAFGTKDYSSARTSYTDAASLKPAEKYPKDKLLEIEKLLKDAAAKEAAEKEKLAKEKELNEKYNAAIASADKAFGAADYITAKAGYTQALSFKPEEKYPKEKITEIDKTLADKAAKDAAEKERLAREKELNDKYNAAVARGDKAFAVKDYSGARAGYSDALALKAGEKYPAEKISEIDKILGEAAAKEAAEKERLAREKEVNEKYAAAIASADKAFAARDYAGAKGSYADASSLKPVEKYPKEKLLEIEKLLADAAAKDAAARALEAKYTNAISSGDKAFASADYSAATGWFKEAAGLKPTEKYPKDKLTEIEKLLADKAAREAAEKEKLAKEKELNDKYNAALAKADKAFGVKDYALAKTGYSEALGLKPGEKYPSDRIAEIEKLLADAASEKERLAREKEINSKYNAAIASGDKAFALKDYQSAKTAYSEASGLKNEEKYPKDKLVEIEVILNDMAKAKDANRRYNEAIDKGDAAFTAKKYDEAKAAYAEASSVKPNENYPKSRMLEIDKLLAGLAAKDAAEKEKLAKEKELNEKYTAAIAKGDQAFSAREYNAAKAAYNEALTLKGAERYPKERIVEIDGLLAGLSKAKEAEASYTAAIARGDKAFTAKDYAFAKAAYQEALKYKPVEEYPKSRMSEIDKILAQKPVNQNTTIAQTQDNTSKLMVDVKDKEEYIHELAKKYPQGVTEELVEIPGKKVVRRIVVNGNDAAEYTKVTTSWGQVFYFKNGDIPISQYKWDTETKK